MLKRGEKVKALYRNQLPWLLSREETEAIEWVKGDILDVVLLHEICSEAEEVYHCAGMVSFNPSRRNELMRINVKGQPM